MKLKKNIALSDTGFVFDPSTGDSFTVNPIGLEIIKHLKDGMSKGAILGLLAEQYETDAVNVEKDYADFTNMLHKLKLTEAHEKAQG